MSLRFFRQSRSNRRPMHVILLATLVLGVLSGRARAQDVMTKESAAAVKAALADRIK